MNSVVALCSVDHAPSNSVLNGDHERSKRTKIDRFQCFRPTTRNLLIFIALGNKLSREWPAKYQNVIGARELFVMHLRIAHLTYRSALYLGGEIPADALRLPEICVSLPVLNRAILDSLFTVLFILEDVPNRCVWFREADWKESRLELDRYLAEYGALPEWKSYLEDLSTVCDMGLALTNLTLAQTANPKALRSLMKFDLCLAQRLK